MAPLQKILAAYRATSQTEREKGTYFEELIRTYFRYEATYADLYSDVWLYADWAKEIGTPEFGFSGNKLLSALHQKGEALETDLYKNSVRRRIVYKTTGLIEYDEFYPRKSKALADQIDTILATHYGFTAEELDLIINYGIKYRMGPGGGSAEEDEE